jgi:hypothetical protein
MPPPDQEVAQLRAEVLELHRLNALLKATIREMQDALREMAWARVEAADVEQPLRLHLVAE